MRGFIAQAGKGELFPHGNQIRRGVGTGEEDALSWLLYSVIPQDLSYIKQVPLPPVFQINACNLISQTIPMYRGATYCDDIICSSLLKWATSLPNVTGPDDTHFFNNMWVGRVVDGVPSLQSVFYYCCDTKNPPGAVNGDLGQKTAQKSTL